MARSQKQGKSAPLVNLSVLTRGVPRRTALPDRYGSCNLTLMKLRSIVVVVFLIATLSMAGCKARSNMVSKNGDGVPLVIDLTKIAPIGIEISGDHPLAIPRGKVLLTIQLPEKFEIPPDQQKLGAKAIVFKPGDHDVDLYKDLHSGRLLYTHASLSIENSVPTIKVKLDTGKLPSGQYMLGISGDPFFAYCPVRLQ